MRKSRQPRRKRKKTRVIIYTHIAPEVAEWQGAPARTPPSTDDDESDETDSIEHSYGTITHSIEDQTRYQSSRVHYSKPIQV